VNEAIAEAHKKGVLSTASLMVGAKFARDAADRARRLPSLRVGLHLTLVEGTPVLPPEKLPDMVDGSGAFSTRLVRAGFKFFFLRGIRKQLEAEIRAQFEAFRKTGLALDHVNAHNHMHLHPTILGLTLKIGKEFGMKAVRLPKEPPFQSWRAAKTARWQRIASWILLCPWIGVMKRMLRQSGVKHNDFLLGMTDSGRMTEDLASRFVSGLPEGITEICFHPATRRSAEIDRTMPRYRHEDEFRGLIGPRLKGTLDASGLTVIAFSDL
jgi:hopanoid biosynthesis associated protein HpnK